MLNLGLLKDDAMNFVAMVEGYYRIFVDDNVCLVEKPASKQTSDPDGKCLQRKQEWIWCLWCRRSDSNLMCRAW